QVRRRVGQRVQQIGIAERNRQQRQPRGHVTFDQLFGNPFANGRQRHAALTAAGADGDGEKNGRVRVCVQLIQDGGNLRVGGVAVEQITFKLAVASTGT